MKRLSEIITETKKENSNLEPINILAGLIKTRRTRKPSEFTKGLPTSSLIDLIDIARNAPNHHRTEPARFYILDSKRISKVGKLFKEVLSDNGNNPSLVQKAIRKEKEWGNAPGLLIVTNYSDRKSLLINKNHSVVKENYATTCCIVQNLLLLFESCQISAKWSTAPVWRHPQFSSTVGIKDSQNEDLVALIFYGYSDSEPKAPTLSSLKNFILDHTESAGI